MKWFNEYSLTVVAQTLARTRFAGCVYHEKRERLCRSFHSLSMGILPVGREPLSQKPFSDLIWGSGLS